MKILFIGGTGTISTEISRRLSEENHDLYLVNRGLRSDQFPPDVHHIRADINDEALVSSKIKGLDFDAVVDFIAFVPPQLERDYRLFKNRTKQFIFISSASAYQKPLNHYRITESTPLANPLWEYSRNKIACEDYLMGEYRKNGFPCTIIRPSHTYDERYLPVAVHGKMGSWQVVDRILKGKPVIVHGDGSSLWTLTHADDFAKAFCGIMGNPLAIGEAIQITSDESLTWNQIYDRIGAALGKEVLKYHVSTDFLSACDPEYLGTLAGDKSNTVVFDNAKIKRLVPDFVATIGFAEGARQCVQYLLENPRSQVLDPEFESFCDRMIYALEGTKAAFFSSMAH